MSYRLMAWLGLLAAGAVMTGCGRVAEVTSCERVVGRWSWFVGGEVDVTRDGQFTQQSGNSGTWECSDAARGEVTFRWRAGGFVNRMVMSADGASLTSADPTQAFVTARRASAAAASTAANATPATAPAPTPVAPSPPRSAPATSEPARLAALINDDYQNLTLTLVSKDFFGDNSVIRTQDLQLDQGFHLVKRFELCDVGWAEEFLSGKYTVTERTHLDCDAHTHDLKWDKRTESIDLATIDPGSIEAQGTPVHRTRLRFGYRGNKFATSYLECRNHSACVRMLGNFTALVRLAASGAQGAQSAPATAGSEVETLATRINAQYAGSQHSFSTMVFKGQSAALEPGYVLALRDLKCDGNRNPHFKDLEFEIASAQRTRLLTQLAADCDARRDGLAWQPTVKRVEFKKMRDPKFEVVKHTDGNLGTHGIRLATLQRSVEGFRPDDVVESIISIACQDQRGCEQMANDLDALVNAIGVPRGTYQRPAGR